MSDAHYTLLNILIDRKWHTRTELSEVVPISELTRRLRELRTAEWGGYTITWDAKKGYRMVDAPDSPHPDMSLARRRRYLEEQAALPA